MVIELKENTWYFAEWYYGPHKYNFGIIKLKKNNNNDYDIEGYFNVISNNKPKYHHCVWSENNCFSNIKRLANSKEIKFINYFMNLPSTALIDYATYKLYENKKLELILW